MMRKRKSKCLSWLAYLSIVALILFGGNYAQAFTLGKTYDNTNWQEIKDMLPNPILDWVKAGEWKIPTAHLEYENELSLDEEYVEKSQPNEGKYDINADGLLVFKETGEPEYVSGNPFPKIDPGDPKIAEKVMENFKFATQYRMGSTNTWGKIKWFGNKGLEREIVVNELLLYYMNPSGGPVANPNNFLVQSIHLVVRPFDLRGTVQMAWTYNDNRVDTAFAYLPMLRRIRRVSAAARSDPFVGSDMTIDDQRGWGGKNASVAYKFIGQETLLAPFSTTKKDIFTQKSDGLIVRCTPVVVKKGCQTEGWAGSAWAPTTLTWYPRPMWVIEGIPDDPYYAFGKMIFYVDQDNYVLYFKPLFNGAGEYWKMFIYTSRCNVTQKGQRWIGDHNYYQTVDDRIHHSSTAEVEDVGEKDVFNVPFDQMNSQLFTEGALRQMSK